MAGNTIIPANAGGILMDRMLSFVAKRTPSEQEKRGDKRLDDARNLLVEHQVTDPQDLQVVEDRIAFARQIKSGLDSKWGPSKFLHAQEYRKSAKSAYHFAQTASARARDAALFGAQRHDTSSVPEMSNHDRVTGVALSLCRVYLGCIDAFPTPQTKDVWAVTVWREACVRTDADLDSFPSYKLFADGNLKLFTETRERIMHAVETLYGFDSSHAADSISRNAALAQALSSDMAFIYREFSAGGKSHPYRHPALQKAINLTWFRNKDDAGVFFHEYFSPLSVTAIALILAVIECCIDEWTEGTRKDTMWSGEQFKTAYQSHISSINVFYQHGIVHGTDLFEHIQSDLLKEARRHAGVPPVPLTGSGRFSPESLDAAHQEDPPPYSVPAIRISFDSEE